MGLSTALGLLLAVLIAAFLVAIYGAFFAPEDLDPFDPDKDEIMARIVKRMGEEK